ncbi:PAS domain S-box protein [Methylolobus aquaticus]
MTSGLFDWSATQGLVPHASCLLWNRDLLRLFAVSDSVIAFSYYSIPFGLAYFAWRRADLAYRWMVLLFAAFILACGTNHMLDVWTLWHPSYVLQGTVKALTAGISLATAVLLWRLIPHALALPGPAQLAALNRDLSQEAEQRRQAVQRLRVEATQRERIQHELSLNEARLRAILDTAIEGIIVFDGNGRIETANPAAASMFGYEGASLVGKEMTRLIPDPGFEWHAENVVRELSGSRRDGGTFPLEIAVGRFSSADSGNYVGLVRDISLRKASEAALRDSEKRLELALLGSDLGTWDWNLATGQIVFSDRWATMLGYEPSEIRSDIQQWEKLVHPDDLPRVQALLDEHLRGLTPLYEAEHRLVTSGGEWLWVLSRGRVMEREPGGTPLRASGTHMDITARKQLELRLAEQNEELAYAQQFTTAGEIAAMMAHELNQPLAALSNYLGGAKLRFGPLLADNPQLLQIIDSALRLSDRAAGVISGIRNLVRKHDFQPAWVTIDQLLEETLQLVSPDLHLRRVRLVVDLPPHLPPVWGQLVLLKQLFLNLVTNGVEAMRDTFRSRRVLTLSARQVDATALRIDVSDTGAGIAPGLEDRMFKPFVSSKPEGLGLGLAICRSIVELHGGEIEAESVHGEGTTFHVTLPLSREEADCGV